MLARQGNRTLLGDHPVCSLALDDLPTPAVTPSVTEVLGFLLTVDSDQQIKLPKAQPGKSKGCQGIPKTLCVARNRPTASGASSQEGIDPVKARKPCIAARTKR